MKNLFYKYKILIAVLMVLLFYYNTNVALLIFLVFFQIGSAIEIIKQLKQFKRAKKGSYSTGHLINLRKIPGNEEDVHNYEGTVEFYWPYTKENYQVKYKFSSVLKPNSSKKYKIWVDKIDPTKSLVVQSFRGHWWYSIFFFIIVIIGLCVTDFILLKRIIN